MGKFNNEEKLSEHVSKRTYKSSLFKSRRNGEGELK